MRLTNILTVAIILWTTTSRAASVPTRGVGLETNAIAQLVVGDMMVWNGLKWVPTNHIGAYSAKSPGIFHDFLIGAPASSANIGFPYFAGAAIASGTSTKLGGEAGTPGILAIASASGANSGYSYNSDIVGILLSGGEEFTVRFKLPNATPGLVTRIGFHDASSAADAVDGVYMSVENGFIYGATANNSSRSVTATSNAVSTAIWYKMHCVIDQNPTNATFTLYSGATPILTNTISANIPTARTTGVGILAYNIGAGVSNIVYVDYIDAPLGVLNR